MANAAMILTRVLLELALDHYAKENKLRTAGDRDAKIDADVKQFREDVGRTGMTIPKSISAALDRAATSAPNLGVKLDAVIDELVRAGVVDRKAGESKKREIKTGDVINLLHDAVHRLDFVPSLDRVTHIHEVVALVFNGMTGE